jgi:hypothetical protein
MKLLRHGIKCILPQYLLLNIYYTIDAQYFNDSLRIVGRMFYGQLSNGKPSGNWLDFHQNAMVAELRYFVIAIKMGKPLCWMPMAI